MQIVCKQRRTALLSSPSCAAEMETRMTRKCQTACLSRAQQRDITAQLDEIEFLCQLTQCTVRCVDYQIQECNDDKSASLVDVYNELAGAQMLVGFSSIFNSTQHVGQLLIDTPEHCVGLMDKTLKLINTDQNKSRKTASAGGVYKKNKMSR
jgi:hypothetical protein